VRLNMDEVRKQHDGIKKLYEQGLRGATANVEQVLDLFDTIEAFQNENQQLREVLIRAMVALYNYTSIDPAVVERLIAEIDKILGG